MRTLILLRHGKSDWEAGVESDFHRPLSARGIKASARIARWLIDQGQAPDIILCSSSERTRSTLRIVLETVDLDSPIEYPDELYLADASTLWRKFTEKKGGAKSVMLVGHNPGCEDLVRSLLSNKQLQNQPEKLFPTAACAIFEFNAVDKNLRHCKPDNLKLMRPREL